LCYETFNESAKKVTAIDANSENIVSIKKFLKKYNKISKIKFINFGL
jgi:hypothetical protein